MAGDETAAAACWGRGRSGGTGGEDKNAHPGRAGYRGLRHVAWVSVPRVGSVHFCGIL